MHIFSTNGKPESTVVKPSNGATNGNGNGNGNGFAAHTILSSDVSIKGEVKFRNKAIVDGKVEGTIHSVSQLTLGKNAHVRGDIKTRCVTVHGTVDGNITVGERCELRSGCTLRGDIESPRLVVDDDANFSGSAHVAIQDHLFAPNFRANGTNGTNGKHGVNGTNGANGSNGANGTNGHHANGTNGHHANGTNGHHSNGVGKSDRHVVVI